MSDIRFNRWLHQSGTGGVYQDSTGSVGIGTSVPTTLIDIQGGSLKIGNHTLSSSSSSLNINGNVSIGGTLDVTNIDSVGIITAQSGLHVTGGSVGIGTDNPAFQLHVLDNTIPASLRLQYGTNAGFDVQQMIDGTAQVWNIDNTDLKFATNDREKLRITAGGNIGIGTLTSPGALLHLRDSNDTTQGAAQLKISKGVGNGAAPSSASRTNCYIHLGGSEWRTGGGGHYLMGFGYTNGETGPGIPAYVGFVETSSSGYTQGDLIFGTRNNTTGTDNAIERLRINSSGIVTKPYTPAFRVKSSTNTSAFTGGTTASWDTVNLNNGSHFLTSGTGAYQRFVAPVNGLYFISCMILSNNNSRVFHEIRVNNVRVDGTRTESYSGTSYQTNTTVATLQLSASDYVTIYVGPNDGYGGAFANFNGFLIG